MSARTIPDRETYAPPTSGTQGVPPAGLRLGQELVTSRLRTLLLGLFPEEPIQRNSVRSGLVGVAVFATAAVLFAARLPVARWNSLWAEDGATFLQSAFQQHWWTALTSPYAGYLHTLPRVAAEMASRLPVLAIPYAFVAVSAGVGGFVAWATWRLSAGLLTSLWLRGGVAAALVLSPSVGLEAVGNVANGHFLLDFGAFWGLLGRPRTRVAWALSSIMVAAAALSDPLTLVYSPLAIARFMVLRGRDRIVVVAYAVGLAVQGVVVLFSNRAQAGSPQASDVAFAYAYRVVSPTIIGLQGTSGLADGHRSPVIWLAAATLGLVTVVAAVGRVRRLPMLVSVASSVVFFLISCYRSLAGGDYPPPGAQAWNLMVGGRYTILPVLLLFTGLVIGFDGLRNRLPAGGSAAMTVLALAPVFTWAITDYRPTPGARMNVPPWSVSVSQLRSSCAGEPEATVSVPVEPGWGLWVVRVPCARLAD